ncbi:hypothetical protein A2625_07405 [candidate division WOR-1 bacterium RIFCSPHIGHO2_01_FULL_53_15]|uniref:DUF2283 domain-containing protein n=1 Tax=candidate division WOR-1 bacterium RIFCSPHIGHO2_01_FULL_53_15 TaxID=1802564 RepID=A0A1F4Q4Q5_UNCSA|nr:MAG: hypothetical protein A2625_07405 [candidate division WOR-1 bacterium RIFCSPHIGHO2_01_FULL_53_15]OGC13947.1 MAG: hypothetical protein A3D23_07360 [candidate division WOR-1 bacterium RIFCSPHIGHO2_02_FULL_53_26]
MEAKEISFHYDKDDNLLDIALGKPKKAISTEVADDLFARKDIRTHKVVGFTILNFEKWLKKRS